MKVIIKLIKNICSVYNNIVNWYYLKINHAEIGSDLKINGRLLLCGKLIIGNHVKINSCLKSNPIGGDTKTIFITGPSGKIIIGDNVGISNSALNSKFLIQIGNNVKIGGGCKLYDSDFHPLNYQSRQDDIDKDINSKPIIIYDDVFIGAHSIILKGVSIGNKSIIGAGSVVSKSIPPNQIWAGNPIRFIKNI